MYPTEKELSDLYKRGFEKYKEGDFFLAHEFWEDMWHYKQLKDRIFIQGLIQISASFYKIQCGNLRGARSLLEKSLNKFQNYTGIHRNINVDKLKEDLFIIRQKYNKIISTKDFDLDNVPDLR
jgi:predicted metal-dependent hydrolase